MVGHRALATWGVGDFSRLSVFFFVSGNILTTSEVFVELKYSVPSSRPLTFLMLAINITKECGKIQENVRHALHINLIFYMDNVVRHSSMD